MRLGSTSTISWLTVPPASTSVENLACKDPRSTSVRTGAWGATARGGPAGAAVGVAEADCCAHPSVVKAMPKHPRARKMLEAKRRLNLTQRAGSGLSMPLGSTVLLMTARSSNVDALVEMLDRTLSILSRTGGGELFGHGAGR